MTEEKGLCGAVENKNWPPGLELHQPRRVFSALLICLSYLAEWLGGIERLTEIAGRHAAVTLPGRGSGNLVEDGGSAPLVASGLFFDDGGFTVRWPGHPPDEKKNGKFVPPQKRHPGLCPGPSEFMVQR